MVVISNHIIDKKVFTLIPVISYKQLTFDYRPIFQKEGAVRAATLCSMTTSIRCAMTVMQRVPDGTHGTVILYVGTS